MRRTRSSRTGILARSAALAAALLLLHGAVETRLAPALLQGAKAFFAAPETAAFLLESALPSPAPETAAALPDPSPEAASPAPSPALPDGPALLLFSSGDAPSLPSAPVPDDGDGVYTVSARDVEITNESGYEVDAAALMAGGLSLSPGGRVLILHTHTCEAYTPDGDDSYLPSDSYRTLDPEQNVVRVGEILTEVLTARGIPVIHDETVHDSPSYSGSYSRAFETIAARLEEYPDIDVVIDLHRDAFSDGSGGVGSTAVELDGVSCARILLVAGTDAGGLEHPVWEKNLTLALYLQAAMNERWPGLARPIDLSQYRYNQHMTAGSLILEVGCTGDTLAEAEAAAERFGECCADVLQGRAVYG